MGGDPVAPSLFEEALEEGQGLGGEPALLGGLAEQEHGGVGLAVNVERLEQARQMPCHLHHLASSTLGEKDLGKVERDEGGVESRVEFDELPQATAEQLLGYLRLVETQGHQSMKPRATRGDEGVVSVQRFGQIEDDASSPGLVRGTEVDGQVVKRRAMEGRVVPGVEGLEGKAEKGQRKSDISQEVVDIGEL